MQPILLIAILMTAPNTPTPVAAGLRAMLAVGREGTGDEAAAQGWKAVVAAGPEALVPTLKAFPKANPIALNWLRLATSAIPAPADVAPLLAFVRDESQHPAARRIAFDRAKSRDPAAAAGLLATRITDRDAELRREAIAARLPAAKSAEELRILFDAARDVDQCETLAKKLDAAGVKVDLPSHYGVITQWQLIGPLDAPASEGFTTAYPPEKAGYDPGMTLDGKGGVKVSWKPVQTTTPDGKIDLNTTLTRVPNAAAFVVAEVVAPEAMPAELRLTTPGAVKVYFNGQQVLARDAYHQGTSRDQYAAKGMLKAGKNTILVKVCQNDQPQPWAKQWEVAARLCDETGGALPVKQQLPGGELVPLAQLPADAKKESK